MQLSIHGKNSCLDGDNRICQDIDMNNRSTDGSSKTFPTCY